jgi:hypothetical protein
MIQQKIENLSVTFEANKKNKKAEGMELCFTSIFLSYWRITPKAKVYHDTIDVDKDARYPSSMQC